MPPLAMIGTVISRASATVASMLTPDNMRGRVSAVNSVFIGASNELGGLESGLVAHWFGPVFSVVSGGIGTLVVVAAAAWMSPELRRYGPLVPHSPPAPAPEVVTTPPQVASAPAAADD